MLINSNYEDSYVEIKRKLIKMAVEASNNVTTFSLLEEIVELQGQFCYSEVELQRYNNDILILKCQLLYKKITEHTSDLIDYGITDRKLMLLKQTIEDFQDVSSQHKAPSPEYIPNKAGVQ